MLKLWPRRERESTETLLERAADQAAARAIAGYQAEQRETRAKMEELQRAVAPPLPQTPFSARGSMYPAYARDHPWHHATYHGTGYRPGQLVTIEVLRRFSKQYDVLRAMINHLKNEVEQVPLQIVPRDDGDKSEATKARIKEARDWFDLEGGIGGAGETRSDFEKRLIEDLHVVGVSAVYLNSTRGGDVIDAVALDAATIRPRVDMLGWPGPGEDWYEQYIDGIKVRGFTSDEMYWKGLYPSTESPYPDSPCEYLALTVLAAMSADTWNREWLTNGTEPGRILPLPADWTPNQAMEYIDYFMALMEANTRKRQQLFFGIGGVGAGTTPTRRDHDFQEFMLSLARRCSGIIGVHLSAIGLGEGAEYASVQEHSISQTSSVGVTKVLTFLAALYDHLLRRKGYDDLQAKFVTSQEEKAGDRAERNTKLVMSAVKTPNEARMEEGLDPMEGGDTLFVPTTLVPLEMALEPPEPAPIPGAPGRNGAPGDESDDGGGDRPPAAERVEYANSARSELGQWERKALRRIKDRRLKSVQEGRGVGCFFISHTIPKEIHEQVFMALKECREPEEVRRVFANAVSVLDDLPPVYAPTVQQHERERIAARWRARKESA